MIGGMRTCGPSPVGRDQNEPEMKSESVLSRWSWSDDFFKNSEGSYPRRSEVRTHVVVSKCCVCDGWCTRTHLLHAHFLHTARSLRTSAHFHACHTHAWLKVMKKVFVACACLHSHDPFFCPCCSFTWHFETNRTDTPVRTILPNFLDPKARVKRTSARATSSLATWPSPFSTEVRSSRSLMRKLPWTMTRRPSTVQTTVSPTSL